MIDLRSTKCFFLSAIIYFEFITLIFLHVSPVFIQGPDQVPLIEDLEQIFMRSWRESHLSEIRQYQQPQTPASQGRHYGVEVSQHICVFSKPELKLRKHIYKQMNNVYCLQTPSTLPGLPQHLSLPPQSQEPLTPSQLPWLAQLAASSSGEGVMILGEHIRSLAQGIQQTFSSLMEERLGNTNYVVIIVTLPGKETQSCVIVTGGRDFISCMQIKRLL